MNDGLLFRCYKEIAMLKGYVDLDYVGHRDRRRPTMTHMFTLSDNCIRRKSQLQFVVKTKTKYMAIIEAVKEAMWLKGLL